MSSENPRVLLAEDESALRRLIAARLKRAGMEVIEVEDGVQLYDYLARCVTDGEAAAPDVVVTDIEMPNESGPHALARCLNLRTPVVLISAASEAACDKAVAEARAAAVFAKPFSTQKLVATIRELMAKPSFALG